MDVSFEFCYSPLRHRLQVSSRFDLISVHRPVLGDDLSSVCESLFINFPYSYCITIENSERCQSQ
jgi:hypothetical protein